MIQDRVLVQFLGVGSRSPEVETELLCRITTMIRLHLRAWGITMVNNHNESDGIGLGDCPHPIR